MRLFTSTILLLLAFSLELACQTQPAFYYQAAIRNTDGTSMVDQDVQFSVALRAGSSTGAVVYSETHTATTDLQGLVALPIGGGTAVSGNYDDVPWDQSIFVDVSFRLNSEGTYSTLGMSEIYAVPFSVFAARGNEGPLGEQGVAGSSIVWLGIFDVEPSDPQANQAYYNTVDSKSYIYDGTQWSLLAQDGLAATNGVAGSSIEWLGISDVEPTNPLINQAYYNTVDGKSYIYTGTEWSILAQDGIAGDVTPLPEGTASAMLVNDGTTWVSTNRIQLTSGTLQVSRTASSPTDAPVFAVYNSAGQLVFAVHEGGTRVYVEGGTLKAGGSKGGFAVGGLSPTKAEVLYLNLQPDSVRFQIVETAKSGGSKGGFAVGGLSPTKATPTYDYLTILADSARINLSNNVAKASKGGFAVGGLSPTKEGEQDLFALNSDTTYIAVQLVAAADVVVDQVVTVSGTVTTTPMKDIDGNEYATVTIGNQTWMADNLRVTRYRDGTPIINTFTNPEWPDTAAGAQFLYPYNLTTGIASDSAMLANYGRLYNNFAASHSLGLCPTGWAIPDAIDLQQLTMFLGGDGFAGGMMKSMQTDPMPHPRWDTPNTAASNSSGFNGFPGGKFNPMSGFESIGLEGAWWSSVPSELPFYAKVYSLYYDQEFIDQYEIQKSSGIAVRCIKVSEPLPQVTTLPVTGVKFNSAVVGASLVEGKPAIALNSNVFGVVWGTKPNPIIEDNDGILFADPFATSINDTIYGLESETLYYVRAFATNKAGTKYGNEVTFTTTSILGCGDVNDVDGNIYKTIQIGSQCWITENLKTTKYRNLEPISTGLDTMQWGSTNESAYAIYDYRFVPEFTSQEDMKSAYGLLYNRFAVLNSQGLCPAGWAAPTSEDITVLASYLGGYDIAGDKLKSTRAYPDPHPRWEMQNTATNESGFSALPGGMLASNYMFNGIGQTGSWWTSSDTMEMTPIYYEMVSAGGFLWKTANDPRNGYSVRCIKSPYPLPTVTTTEPYDISFTTAWSGYNVNDTGGDPNFKAGVVWGVSSNPTIENKLGIAYGPEAVSTSSILVDKLEPLTSYYVRAFAINKAGVSYGNELIFSTINYPNCGTVKDTIGNVYNTIMIGGQCWMRENLRTTAYKNGSSLIPGQWVNPEMGGFFHYPSDTVVSDWYGLTYSWGAVISDSICPIGWYMPDANDWQILIDQLGGSTVAGGNMKGTKVYDGYPENLPWWYYPNEGATNTSGFSAYPAGEASSIMKQSSEFGDKAYFWSSSKGFDMSAYALQLSSQSAEALLMEQSTMNGYSIRCLSLFGKPRVKTIAPEAADLDSISSGIIISDNSGYPITSYGLVWSTSPDPTYASHVEGGILEITADFLGVDSTGINGLLPNTKYYIRAFAQNSQGIGYGKSFPVTTFNSVIQDIDLNNYFTVVIGEQEWMARNLRTTKYRDGFQIDKFDWYSPSGAFTWFNGNTLGDSTMYADMYGAYYSSSAVMTDKLCPSGWYIPTAEDYQTLIVSLGGFEVAGGKLKSTRTLPPLTKPAWAQPNTGATNESGFTGLPGGSFDGSWFNGESYMGYWWTSSPSMSGAKGQNLVEFQLHEYNSNAEIWADLLNSSMGYSIRCISSGGLPIVKTLNPTEITISSITLEGNVIDDSGFPVTIRGLVWSTTEQDPTLEVGMNEGFTSDGGTGTGVFSSTTTPLANNTLYYIRTYATNGAGTGYGKTIVVTTYNRTIAGNDSDLYNTIIIGGQEWMAENLKTTVYANLTAISNMPAFDWASIQGLYIWYNEDVNLKDTLGALYDWYVVSNPAGLCPLGWRIPTDNDWKVLEVNLGLTYQQANQLYGRGTAAGKLKEVGFTSWMEQNIGATNETGFTARGSGIIDLSGMFMDRKFTGKWWTATSANADSAFARSLSNSNTEIYRDSVHKKNGFSVRCIYDDQKPVVFTVALDSVRATTANVTYNLTSAGGGTLTASGIAFSTDPNPDLSDFFTINGVIATGTFTEKLTGLNPNTSYYARAYATNNTGGTSYGNEFTFTTISASIPIENFEAGFSPGWVQDSPGWTIDGTTTFQGSFSAKSLPIPNEGITSMSITMETTEGYISFYRKISSQEWSDYLTFYINDTYMGGWSGAWDWENVSYWVSAGVNEFRWEYSKDMSTSSGMDCAWIDNIIFPHMAPVQFIVTDNSFNPIESAEININSNYYYTDASGMVNEMIPSGNYWYSVNATGYNMFDGMLDVYSGMPLPVNIQLQPMQMSYSVLFTVTDGVNPVENAEITIAGQTLYTQPNGQISSSPIIEGYHPFSVFAAGFDPYNSGLEVMDMGEGMAWANVVLTPMPILTTFSVVNELVLPVQGADVFINGQHWFTDAIGNITVPLNIGIYPFTVDAAGYLTYNNNADIYDEGGGTRQIDVQLQSVK